MSAYIQYSYLIQQSDRVAPNWIADKRFSIFANLKRHMFGVSRHVSNEEETIVHALVSDTVDNRLLCDDCTMESSLEDETINFGKSPATPDRVVHKRFKLPYLQRVVRELRVEFPFALTLYTKANYGAIYFRAGAIMTVHGLRKTLIASLAAQAASLYFIPNSDDIQAQNLMDSAEAMLSDKIYRSGASNKSTPISNVIGAVVPRLGKTSRRGFVPDQ
jgi:hypothetical protein